MQPQPPFPPQKDVAPGSEYKMNPRPRFEGQQYRAAGKLKDKCALITGGDSGIGRAVAVIYAREGAHIAISYLPSEERDAQETAQAVRDHGRKCILLPGDLSDREYCREVVDDTVRALGKIDILVSNAAYQARKQNLFEITDQEWDRTFKTNIYAYFYLVQSALPHLKPGSCIIATSSETAHTAPKELLDYSATKGAINSFTRSLAHLLIDKQIRVNAVAPGPVWTPLNVSDSGTSEKKVSEFGKKQPIHRPAQPEEIAPAYVFLASQADSSYITGAILAETGGLIIN